MSFHQAITTEMAIPVGQLFDEALLAEERGPRVLTLNKGPGYELRRITLLTGQELVHERDVRREKTWRVVSGIGHADIDEADIALMPGGQITIEHGALHQIENLDAAPLIVEELSISVEIEDRARDKANALWLLSRAVV